jgi:hypothetical protein
MAYKKLIRDRISDELFIKTCTGCKSMSAAAAKLNLHFNSFKKRAQQLGCYIANQPGKGLTKIAPKIPLSQIIIEGKHPHYQTCKLKNRLFSEGIKKPNCEICKISEWFNKPISFELHHIDGNRHNHLLDNLKLLCPNCHSQTDTFRAKNKKI